MQAQSLFDVKGQVSVVTGAASGLGLAFAEVMAANGARVLMADMNAETLAAAANKVAKAGGAVETALFDVADRAALTAAIDGMAKRHGRLDSVFANAGMSAGPGYTDPTGGLEAFDWAKWDRVLAVNLTSVMATIRAAAPHLKRRRSGHIVVTASIAGIGSEEICGYAYIATKAAVANLVRQAAHELGPHNVTVNAIAPGFFLTNIGNGRLNDPAVREAFARRVPLGRVALPDDIKGLALLLASPAGAYINGTVIPIDGGVSA